MHVLCTSNQQLQNMANQLLAQLGIAVGMTVGLALMHRLAQVTGVGEDFEGEESEEEEGHHHSSHEEAAAGEEAAPAEASPRGSIIRV